MKKGTSPYTSEDAAPYSVWRHVKTDSLYVVMGEARCSTSGPDEGKKAVVYFSLTYGHLYYRDTDEFLDGRFEPVTPSTKSPRGEGG